MTPTGMDDSVLGYYTKLGRIGLNDLEFDRGRVTTNQESVTFAYGAVCWNA
jgi:hypothetical protein